MATPRSTSPKKTAAKKPAAKKSAEKAEPQNRAERRAEARNSIRPTSQDQAVRDARKRFKEIMGDGEDGATTSIDALAELEAEAGERRELDPFTIKIGVDEDDEPIVIEIGSPEELEYAITVSGNYDLILSRAMSQEDWETFIDSRLTTRQVYLIYTAWRLYYGLPDEGEADA